MNEDCVVEPGVPQADTFNRIIAAAGSLLLRNGYEATTMGAVAREVGVSSAALYWHFDSKQALVRAVVKSALENFDDRVIHAIQYEQSVVRRFERFVGGYLEAQLEWRSAASPDGSLKGFGFVQLLLSLDPEDRETMKPTERRIYQKLKELITSGVDQGAFVVKDVSIAALTILVACDYMHTWYDPNGRLTQGETVAAFVALAKRIVGLAAPL